MSVKQIRKTGTILAISVLLLTGSTVAAQTSSSNSYRVDEYQFGTGGDPNLNSSSYNANASLGSLGVGDASSANYDATAGFLTPSEPFLEMSTTGATVNFGDLSDVTTSYGAAQAGACNCSFYVRSYLSSDYTVVTVSNPPTNESGFSLTAKSTLGAPSGNQNTEEFGINLVANTVPAAMGADPSNQPTGSYADGQAATGYSTTNQYKYGVGDIIARSPATVGNQGVGLTNYTISYIAKINSLTRAGLYTMNHDLVAVPTY
jgi:hypothetical protein